MNIYLTENIKELDASISQLRREIDGILPKLIEFGKLLLIAIIVYMIGRKISKWIVKLVEKSIGKTHIEPSVAGFILALLKVALYAVLIIMIVGILGLDTSSLVALIGSAGLTIGLALQGSLSNFAGGVLILVMKPFRVGDYIVNDTLEGTVKSIDLFYTKLLTVDNRIVVLPNGTLSNSNIINVTNEPVRRLDLTISIGYTEEIDKAKAILTQVANQEELSLKDYDTSVYVSSFNPSSITLGVRVWVNTENYWTLKCELLEHMKKAFDDNGIIVPYDKLDVNILNK